jgi:methyltransferase family protein
VPEMDDPRNGTSFGEGARPSRLITDVFERIRSLPGWFNVDDCAHFHLILSLQTSLGMVGDLLEIGSYHGRSTCMLAYSLQPPERLVVCDAFDQPTDEPYRDRPTESGLMANLLSVAPSLRPAQVRIVRGYSRDLAFEANQAFRFAHIDGGHAYDTVTCDLLLVAANIMPRGVIAVDDYENRMFPAVTRAVDDFLGARADYSVLADLNRHGAIGRKIYLLRSADVTAAKTTMPSDEGRDRASEPGRARS